MWNLCLKILVKSHTCWFRWTVLALCWFLHVQCDIVKSFWHCFQFGFGFTSSLWRFGITCCYTLFVPGTAHTIGFASEQCSFLSHSQTEIFSFISLGLINRLPVGWGVRPAVTLWRWLEWEVGLAGRLISLWWLGPGGGMQPTCAWSHCLHLGQRSRESCPGGKQDGSPQPSGTGLNISGCVLFSPCCWLMFALSEESNKIWDFALLWDGGCVCSV